MTETEAQRARKAAEAAYQEALAQRPEVERLTSSLRRLRETNHFSERIAIAMSRKKKKNKEATA